MITLRIAGRLATLAVLLTSASLTAQQPSPTVLDLRLVEAGGDQPVREARVQVEGVRRPAWSDARGRVRIGDVPAGRRRVTITRPGYTPEILVIGFGTEPVTGEVEMNPVPIALAPVTVVAAQQRRALAERGFYDRMRRGRGRHLAREDIARMQPVATIDVVRRLPGFAVRYTPEGQPTVISTRGALGFGGECSPMVYVDGMEVQMPSGRVDPSEVVSPEQIEAIEAYAGPASIPPELNITGSACGVLVIWTRMGL